MDEIKGELETLGWHLSSEGLEICKEELGASVKTATSKDISKIALNVDLSDIGDKYFPDDFSKGKVTELKGPCVLQVVKIRNISAPKANETSGHAPRMLQIQLTDGHRICTGIEYEKLADLNLDVAPGSKVRLKGSVEIRNGMLLLVPQNTSLLGGRVESIYKKWLAAREASGFSRIASDVDEKPPPFVDFGKKISYGYSGNKRSLPKSDKDTEESSEFQEQRQAAIAEVQKSKSDFSGKIFSSASGKQDPAAFPDKGTSSSRQEMRKEVGPSTKPLTKKFEPGDCDRLTQMGFSRQDVMRALRNNNNDIEKALDSLLSPADQPQEPRGGRFSAQSRGDQRGGRGGRGRFGGRGRSRGNQNEEEGDEQRPSTTTTLFDFLETKIATPSAQTAGKPKASKPESSRAGTSREVDLDEDERLQDEYLLEYVRELSLVETHGGGSDVEKIHASNNDTEGRASNGPRNNQHREQYSRRGGRDQGRYGDSGGRFDGRSGGKSRPPRNNSFRDDRPPRNESRRDRQNNGYYERDEPNTEANYSSHNYRGEDGKRGKSYRGSRNGRNGREFSGATFDESVFRGNDRARDLERNRVEYNSFGGGGGGGGGGGDHRPRHNERRANEVPPRFRKMANTQQNRHSDEQRRYNQSAPDQPIYQSSRRTEDREPVAHEQKKGLTLADTAKQLREATVEPRYGANDDMRMRPVSYENRDSGRHHRPSAPESRGPRFGGRQWAADDHCKAKYWEDNKFYDAVVINVHISQMTAVVRYSEYGNCEEVNTADMQRIDFKDIEDSGSYDDRIFTQEFTRGGRRPPQHRPNPRQRRTPARPDIQLYQAPGHKET